jgi:metalloprotein, YbeY/UPF0054 family
MVFNSLKKFNIYNETNIKLDIEIKSIKKILNKAIKKEKLNNIYFNVILIDNKTIKEINNTYRSINKETDVISFALEDNKNNSYTKKRLLGDIYISIDKAKEQAISLNQSVEKELCFLSVHGLLHLLGYDHIEKKDEEIMIKKQKEIINN